MIDWIKENVVISLVVFVLLVFAGFGIVSKLNEPSQEKISKYKTEQTVPSSTTKQTLPAEEETVDDKNYRTAKLKLEQPYSEASEEDKKMVTIALDEAVAAIKAAGHLSAVQGSIENHFAMSQDSMVQTFAMALLVNQYEYQPSLLEVMPSDSEDVVQFLLVLKKENEENCYFVGNFNTTVEQLQLKSYVGGNIGGTFG